jgi:TolB protein
MTRLRTIPVLLAALAASACGDATAPLADGAVYDLVFESTASPQETQSRVFRLRSGESTPTSLFGDQIYATQPRVSADGRWVAFVAPASGGVQDAVWLARTDGTERRQVFSSDGVLARPAPSPDGSRIAFQYFDATNGSSMIWLVNAGGSGAYAITTQPHPAPFVHTAPAWSPDGLKIAFAMGEPGTLQLATMSADGGPITALTQPTSGSDTDPHWSPDGRSLAFVHATAPAQNDIAILDFTTGQRRTLFTGNARDPAWSPTGQVIAFSARIGGEAPELYVISADGGAAQRVTTNEVADRHPNWVRRTP